MSDQADLDSPSGPARARAGDAAPTTDGAGRSRHRVLTVAAIGISMIQASLFALLGGRQAGLAIPLALLSVGLGLRLALRTAGEERALRGALLALLALQAALFARHLLVSDLPFPHRLLEVALILAYAAPVVGWSIGRIGWLPVDTSYLVTCSLALGLLLSESILEAVEWRSPQDPSRGAGVERVGDPVEPQPDIGYHPARNGRARSYYPDDPRGYFSTADPVSRLWTLNRIDTSRGRLVPTEPEVARIEGLAGELAWESPDFERPPAWHVRLSQAPLAAGLDPGRYTLRFRARSDRARSLVAAVVQTERPWGSVGLQTTVELAPEWRTFDLPFSVSRREEGARVEFQVGDDRWPVELAGARLERQPSGERLEVDLKHPYFVAYSFNDLGCRGPDYAIPRPPDTTRLLMLGDSFTLGMGVHEVDTFASVLERSLDEDSPLRRFEVVNCGASGYATEQERLHYELISSIYEPQVVVVTMHRNDARSYLEALEKGELRHRPGRAEQLFRVWDRIQLLRHREPAPDYTRSVEELRKLHQACRRDGVRLAVVIFRIGREPAWDALTDAVTTAFEHSDVPVLDLGPALLGEHEEADLWVHPSDAHPNELAHRIAAEQIARFLDEQGLLAP